MGWKDPYDDYQRGKTTSYGATLTDGGNVLSPNFRLVSGNMMYIGDEAGDAAKLCRIWSYHLRPGDRQFLDDGRCQFYNTDPDLNFWLSAEAKDHNDVGASTTWPANQSRTFNSQGGDQSEWQECGQFGTLEVTADTVGVGKK